MADKTKRGKYLQIANIGDKLKEDLATIAGNKGITLSEMIRPVLRKFVKESEPRLLVKRDH